MQVDVKDLHHLVAGTAAQRHLCAVQVLSYDPCPVHTCIRLCQVVHSSTATWTVQ